MNPTSEQALRAALDHETTSIVRQLHADNERLRIELATANANLRNRYLRSVLNLIDKHRDMEVNGGVELSDERLVLHNDGLHMDDQQAMLEQLYQFPLEDKLAIIPVLCGLGYWVMQESNIDRHSPFAVLWDQTEEDLRMDCDDDGFFTRGGILHRPTE